MSSRFSVVLTLAIFVGAVPLATPVHAQTCEQELARQDAALRQFETDARREGVDFVLDDVRRNALGEVNKRLKGDPTADAARDINARWEEYQAYVNQGRTFHAVAAELSRCLRSPGGCLAQIAQSVRRHIEASRLSARIGEAVQKWIDSLGNEGISRAVERVDRTRGILENFTNRAAGTATQAATNGIASCLRDFDRRVQQAQNNPAPVDPRQPPSVSPPPKKGMSGTMAAIGVALAGGTAAVLYGVNAIEEANNAAGGGSSSSDPSQIRLVGNPAIRCTRVGGASLQSLCTGDIMLDVGNVFSGGTQVCIRTDPSAFLACQVRSSSSQLAFRIDERIVNVDFNGNITGCRPIQTGIFAYSGAATGVSATARVNANIPVTCN